VNHTSAGLLGALRERPDDKELYLVLADWCLEQPDEATQTRGTYIQLSLSRGKQLRTDPAVRDLRERLRTIERRWQGTWLGSLREFGHRCDFLPGGLVKLEVTGGRAFHGRKAKPPTEEQFAWVKSLDLRSAAVSDLRWLARRLPAGYVHSFQVQVRDPERLAEVLGECRWLRGLRSLSLCPNPVPMGDAEVVRFAGARHLGDLRELRLFNTSLDVGGCSALCNSPHLRQLSELTLSSCGLTAPALRALLSPSFTLPLTALSLEHNEVSRAATEILVAWPGLACVRKLNLDRNPLGDEGLAVLARSPCLGELRELSLRQCGLTTTGLRHVARAQLPRIASLDVSCNDGIGDTGLLAICESSGLSSLRTLRHSRYRIHGMRPRTLAALNARFGPGHNPQP
jgi:uncharacterized protein (TIGR02996 family)